MPFVWGIATKVIGVVALVVAVFVVAWYFYIHDHASRTEGSVAASLQRVLDADDVTCREADGGWRCRAGRRTFDVRKDGKKNCWRARGTEANGCVKVTDFVKGLF
jgi:hypothetical protein